MITITNMPNHKEQILEEFKKKWCKTRGGGFLDLFCHIDDVAKALDKFQQATIEEIEKKVDERKKLYKKQFDRAKKVSPKSQRYIVISELTLFKDFLDKLKKGG